MTEAIVVVIWIETFEQIEILPKESFTNQPPITNNQ